MGKLRPREEVICSGPISSPPSCQQATQQKAPRQDRVCSPVWPSKRGGMPSGSTAIVRVYFLPSCFASEPILRQVTKWQILRAHQPNFGGAQIPDLGSLCPDAATLSSHV